ncbi:hypothetical protein J5F27_06510 [Schleiferilactobacillus harbinensis]|uniref:hypothetical protein n=1 Tax=Schleiferilactobacillus harbinensis TaxID=304207 RepID=UPI001AAE8D7C|nr:hypothetical protein [Schleiferilactobacillus harbinensis]MBO3091572.1 hypothetical protein [Schleiferilactobacillus harbinensis]
MATNRNTFTTAGLKLTAQVQAGQTNIMFTRAVGSEIDLHAKTDDELSILFAKDIPVNQETQVSGVKVVDDTTVQVEAVFNQSKTAKAFTLNTLGLFAKPVDDKTPGEEILYSIVTFENGQYVYPDNAGSAQTYWISSTIGDTDKLEIILPEDGTSGLGQAALDMLEGRIKDTYATKDELGKPARSVTINGGDKILPATDGNIAIVVPAPDMSKYTTTDKLVADFLSKVDAAKKYLTIEDGAKYRTADQVSAQIDTALAGYIKPITRTAYDKLSTADKQNGIWAIDEKG